MQSLVCERLQNEIFVILLPGCESSYVSPTSFECRKPIVHHKIQWRHILERSRTELELRNSSCRAQYCFNGSFDGVDRHKSRYEITNHDNVECNELSSALKAIGGTCRFAHFAFKNDWTVGHAHESSFSVIQVGLRLLKILLFFWRQTHFSHA
jgi:hypothetical protein